MGITKEHWAREQEHKEEAALRSAESAAEACALIHELHERIEESALQVGELRGRLAETTSFKSQCKGYLIGGLVGALLSLALSRSLG